MTTEAQEGPEKGQKEETRGRWITGIALILIGLLALGGQLLDDWGALGLLFLPALGLIFLVWGAITREGGLLIPGGILSGIGAGVYLMQGPFAHLGGTGEPGVFLLAFAGGWALITLLSAVFTDNTMTWPLIPGGILALIGIALLIGGAALTVLEIAGQYWPVILILIGLYVIIKRK